MLKMRWGFTIALGLVYIGVFNFWLVSDRLWVVLSALVTTILLGLLLVRSARQGYFVNLWDGIFHASVIVDIFLEGLWIRTHDHRGFYLCAAAFAVVLGGYRWLVSRSHRDFEPIA